MLPDRLQRPECPAETLADQRVDRFGNFRAADRFFVVKNLPAVAANRERQVGIFRHRIARKAALAAQQVRSPRAHGARHHGNAIQQIKRALFEVLAGDVFERLPAREPAIAVHHFHVAGYCANFRIGEMAHQPRNRVRVHDRIGVDAKLTISPVASDKTVIQRRGLAMIRLQQQAYARIAPEIAAHQLGGAVERAVVHHENFKLWIIGRQRGMHRIHDDGFFVVGRNQHGHAGLVIRMIRRRRAKLFNQRQEPDDQRPPAHQQNSRNKNKRD